MQGPGGTEGAWGFCHPQLSNSSAPSGAFRRTSLLPAAAFPALCLLRVREEKQMNTLRTRTQSIVGEVPQARCELGHSTGHKRQRDETLLSGPGICRVMWKLVSGKPRGTEMETWALWVWASLIALSAFVKYSREGNTCLLPSDSVSWWPEKQTTDSQTKVYCPGTQEEANKGSSWLLLKVRVKSLYSWLNRRKGGGGFGLLGVVKCGKLNICGQLMEDKGFLVRFCRYKKHPNL